MPIDASIYGQIKPAPSVLETAGEGMKLQALMGQKRLQDLQTGQLEKNISRENAVDQVFASAQPGASLESLLPEVYKAGGSKAGIDLAGKILTQQSTRATLNHTNAQTQDLQAGHIAGSWAALAKEGGSDDAVRETSAQLVPYIGQAAADARAQKLLSMPPEQRLAYAVSQAGQHKTGQEAIKLFFPQASMQKTGSQIVPVSTSTIPGGAPAGTQIPGATPIQVTQSPDSKAADARAASEGNANRANRRLIAGVDENGKPTNTLPEGPIDLAGVSPADLEAGYRYFSDGTLPPNMGRGQQGMAESKRIRGIAAQISQNLGVSPEDARANQLAFKGSGQAITQLVRREAQIGANVRNFDFNASQVLDLSQKVDRTGVPVVNAWLNAGRRAVSGDPTISAFDVAVKTTVNEFAQIVSGTTGGATTEGEKQKAEKLLSAAQTPQQVVAVVNQMRVESANRMKSFADQKRETLASMRSSGAPKKEEPAAAPTAGGLVATVKTDADFDKLKSGALFIGPDGKQRRKP